MLLETPIRREAIVVGAAAYCYRAQCEGAEGSTHLQ